MDTSTKYYTSLPVVVDASIITLHLTKNTDPIISGIWWWQNYACTAVRGMDIFPCLEVAFAEMILCKPYVLPVTVTLLRSTKDMNSSYSRSTLVIWHAWISKDKKSVRLTYRPQPPSGSWTERRYLTISFFQASARGILATWHVIRSPEAQKRTPMQWDTDAHVPTDPLSV